MHKCSKCGGNSYWDGLIRTSYPPKYAHICDRCGNIEYLEKNYNDDL